MHLQQLRAHMLRQQSASSRNQLAGPVYSAGYKLFVATHCTVAAAKSCAKATGQNSADVIQLYSYTYAPALPGKLAALVAGPKALLPVPQVSTQAQA
jgi:hypothetical protein